MNSLLYPGIFIPTHRIVDADSKEKAAKTLSKWENAMLPGEEWIAKLDAGQTIQPSRFNPKDDGTFTHAIENWVETHFVCADGDNIKGVEFLDNGKDKNPDGIDGWTEANQLSNKFPRLLTDVYAVGESVSSMLVEPLHRRFRLIFVFDRPIQSEAHYRHILLTIAGHFPIIPKVSRSPAQPVFGNAREGFKFHIAGNILNLDDYPMPEEKQTQTPQQYENRERPNEALDDYLRRHHIEYTVSRDGSKFYVECPYRNGHTGQKQGDTDSYVWDDGRGWAYYCSHAHCQDKRTWNDFKNGHGIRSTFQQVEERIQAELPSVEDQVEQSDEEEMYVPFPEEMFYGIFQSYRDSLEGRTPIPDAFIFASLKQILSASLGRRIHIESEMPIFPNTYTALIGESSTAHKGVALTVVQKLLRQSDPNVFVLPQVTTDEGLIDLFKTPELKTAKNEDGDNYDYYINGISDLLPHERVDEIVGNIDSHESVRIMASFEELSAILNQSKKVTLSGITERFMQLYDARNEVYIPNKGDKARADFPTFTMIGASAFELIEESLAQYFITAGFTNRIEWYIGQEKPPMFLYKTAHADLWSNCVEEIKKLRDSYVVGQSFQFTEEAYELGDRWNKEFTEHLSEVNNMLVSGSMKRMKIIAMKNALIFAALEHRGDFKIQYDDMANAIRLSQYNCTVVEKLFSNFAKSEHQKVCNRIREILKKTPMLSANQIQNQMKWADVKDIHLGLDLMSQMKMIMIAKPKRTNLYYVPKPTEIE